MRSLSNLNIKKSIESKKLSYNESWFEKFDTAFNYFIFSLLIFYSIVIFKGLDPLSDNRLEYFFYHVFQDLFSIISTVNLLRRI